MQNNAKEILKSVFGYDAFRPLQAEVIDSVLRRSDTLVVMPTGGGKSLCYQIPALIFEGLTVVISPLISLMKDQVDQLREQGVEALLLNSSLSLSEYTRNVQRIRNGQAKLLYVAPETLVKRETLELLESIRLDCLTIDEAHCISEWGHDFRPEYRQIVRVRQKFPQAVCIALTATATPRVQADICENLHFQADNKFVASFDRENLFLQVVKKDDPVAQVLSFLDKFKQQSGVIYCATRKQVDALTANLQHHDYNARPYHAGLDDSERRANQEAFVRDDVSIIVATIAFGMGINKSNVRFIVHYDLPKSIESYYQEIGRAGRDGLRADCLLLFGYGDTRKIRYFIDQKEDPVQFRVALEHLEKMVNYAEHRGCRRVPLIQYFGENYAAESCQMCDNCTVTEPEELSDVTIPAQKFLSCVYRTGQYFGAGHIIDVLRGSKSEKIIQRGHQNLSTYGIGREYSKKQWLNLSRQFVQQGLLSKELVYGSLKLTAKANSVLKGESKVFATVEAEKITYAKGKEAAAGRYDATLFERLRTKRKQLADAANVPPYVVFSDKTLTEMATHLPQSQANLLQISGVGEVKAQRYGEIFLKLIRHRVAETRSLRMDGRPRHEVVAEKYNLGASIEDLAAEYGVKTGTILDHLSRFWQSGQSLRKYGLLAHTQLPTDQREKIFRQFEIHGTERLKPIFEAFDGKVSYEELRVLRLVFGG